MTKPCIFHLSPKQFSILSSIIGLSFIDGLNTDQQNALGNFLVNVGQNILTAAAQAQALDNDNQDNYVSNEIHNLKCQLKILEDKIKNQT